MSGFEDVNMEVSSHLDHLSVAPTVTADERKRNRLDSPSSPAPSSLVKITPTRGAGIIEFGPTQLEVIEEAQVSWILENWETAAFETPIFTVGGAAWKVSYAVNQKHSHVSSAYSIPNISMFLVAADAQERKRDDPAWGVCAELILGLSNPKAEETMEALQAQKSSAAAASKATASPALSIFSSASKNSSASTTQLPSLFACSQSSFHRFNSEEVDWGFNQFSTGEMVKNGSKERGFGPLCAPDSSIEIVAKVRVLRDPTGVLWHNFNSYNGKKVTGFVGLTNQGATCYMNSFLESIYLTNEFRKAVYRIPTANNSPTDSIPLALQRIFYKLQTQNHSPDTTELTKSFGWDTAESFMQHDVQEFSRVLLDDLENKMKGSEVEGTVERLFRGKMRNVLRCTNVDYESVREESFYDLQLTIKDVPNLKESFERYVAAEMLCGDNQYRTDSFGLQDAKKFVEFQHFPPVLHVHLERYAFDMMAEATVKIHDRFEFPTQIDLSPYLSETSPDRGTPQNYWLHSVLVHAGDGHGGHYFVYIRHPNSENRWYKFDDNIVTPCTEQQAVNQNFGGNDTPYSSEEAVELERSTGVKPSRYRKYTSAYLLVYMRQADLGDLLAPVAEEDVPAYLVERIKADDEAEARRRQELHHRYLSTNVLLITDPLMSGHRFGDFVDTVHPACEKRFSKEETVAGVRDYVIQNGYLGDEEKEFDDVEVYHMCPRKNKTLRPDTQVTDLDSKTLTAFGSRIVISPLSFYFRPVNQAASEKDDLWHVPVTVGRILVALKWFNEEGELIPLGSISVSLEATMESILPSVQRRMPLDSEKPLYFYEELKPTNITPIENGATFAMAKLRQGDIIILTNVHNGPVEYFSDFTSCRVFGVEPVQLPGAKTCSLQKIEKARISTKWTLPQLLKWISSELGLDEDQLRVAFTVSSDALSTADMTASSVSLDSTGRTVPMQFLRTDNPGTVADFLQGASAADEVIIRYEVTPIPAKKAESMMRLIVQEGSGLPTEIAALLPKVVYVPRYTATVTDLFAKLGITESVESFRLLECFEGRIRRTFTPKSATELLSKVDYENVATCLYLEAKEKETLPNYKLISCITFERTATRPHGVPFKFVLIPDEPVRAMRARLSQKLGIDCTNASLYICTGIRERKLEDESECLAGIPALDDEDHLGVQIGDHRIVRSSSGFDGAIRFRKTE